MKRWEAHGAGRRTTRRRRGERDVIRAAADRWARRPRRVYVAAVVRELWWVAVAMSAAGAAIALVAWGGAS